MNAPDRIKELFISLSDAFVRGSLTRLKLGGYHGAEIELKATGMKKIATKGRAPQRFIFRCTSWATTSKDHCGEPLALPGQVQP